MAAIPSKPSAPHLADVEAQEDPTVSAEVRRLRDIERTLWTRIWQGIAIACVVLNIVAMIWEWSGISFAAGLIAIFIAAAVFYFQFAIQDTDCKSMIIL